MESRALAPPPAGLRRPAPGNARAGDDTTGLAARSGGSDAVLLHFSDDALPGDRPVGIRRHRAGALPTGGTSRLPALRPGGAADRRLAQPMARGGRPRLPDRAIAAGLWSRGSFRAGIGAGPPRLHPRRAHRFRLRRHWGGVRPGRGTGHCRAVRDIGVARLSHRRPRPAPLRALPGRGAHRRAGHPGLGHHGRQRQTGPHRRRNPPLRLLRRQFPLDQFHHPRAPPPHIQPEVRSPKSEALLHHVCVSTRLPSFIVHCSLFIVHFPGPGPPGCDVWLLGRRARRPPACP